MHAAPVWQSSFDVHGEQRTPFAGPASGVELDEGGGLDVEGGGAALDPSAGWFCPLLEHEYQHWSWQQPQYESHE